MTQKEIDKLIDKALELYLKPDTDAEYEKIMKKIKKLLE